MHMNNVNAKKSKPLLVALIVLATIAVSALLFIWSKAKKENRTFTDVATNNMVVNSVKGIGTRLTGFIQKSTNTVTPSSSLPSDDEELANAIPDERLDSWGNSLRDNYDVKALINGYTVYVPKMWTVLQGTQGGQAYVAFSPGNNYPNIPFDEALQSGYVYIA
jgi:hypothetical protein